MSLLRREASERSGGAVLCRYFLGSYLAVSIAAVPFLLRSWAGAGLAGLYSACLFVSYSAIYLCPALLISGALYLLLRDLRSPALVRRLATAAIYGSALLLVVCVELALVVDGIVLREFGFHLNGFVLNLVTTPGGIESMGLGEALPLTCSAAALVLCAVQAAILWVAHSPRFERRWPRPTFYALLPAAIVLVSATEHATYILGDVRADTSILAQAHAFPLYLPITARKLARSLGLETPRHDDLAEITPDQSPLEYPRRPIEVEAPARPMNVVWLVGESLRFDALTPEVMPATWALAQKAWSFQRHLSGGNGTRMGVFSMFYGLHGPYWFSFLDERRSPVLMDVLRDQGYQMQIHTSARFSYPEFDRTVFSGIPDAELHDSRENYYSKSLDRGWKNDREHTDDIVEFIRSRDRSAPFFVYMFFESTHYRYYFPEESVIREPYVADPAYAPLGVNDSPVQLHNRYLNAAHHLDGQVGRILGALSETGDFEDTIVIVTGDHGEEFMEKGRQGHNSEFHDEQIHVPLVLWVPGSSPRRIETLTSHVDIAPTLLPLLGVKNPPEDYCVGRDLRGAGARTHAVVADWSRIAVVDQESKLTVPMGGEGILANAELTTPDDAVIPEPAEPFRAIRPVLAHVMTELHQFRSELSPAEEPRAEEHRG